MMPITPRMIFHIVRASAFLLERSAHLLSVAPVMNHAPAASLRQIVEPLASLSLRHLRPATRELLAQNALSVNAYPTSFGGMVFVGAPRQRVPVEHDLDVITRIAEQAGVVWLLFDTEAPVIEGLPVFEPSWS